MSNYFDAIGFKRSPYRQLRFEPTAEDVALFAKRNEAEHEFWELINSRDEGGIIVVSGKKGVGKSSFFNFQQFMAGADPDEYGMTVVPSYQSVNLEAYDGGSTRIAQDIVHTVAENIQKACNESGKPVHEEVSRITKWLSNEPDDQSRSVTALGFGFSEAISVPPPGNSSLKNWSAVLKLLVAIAREKKTGFDGVVVGVENIDDMNWSQLLEILTVFRDTLFAVKHVWWALIGGPSLYFRLKAEIPQVTQMIAGEGLEIEAVSSQFLHNLIDLRVKSVCDSTDLAVSPFSDQIINLLHEAGNGVPRYILKCADDLLMACYANAKDKVKADIPAHELADYKEEDFARAFATLLTSGRFDDGWVRDVLREKIRAEFATPVVKLRGKQLDLLNGASGAFELEQVATTYKKEGEPFELETFRMEILEPMIQRNLLRETAPDHFEFIEDAFLYRELCLS